MPYFFTFVFFKNLHLIRQISLYLNEAGGLYLNETTLLYSIETFLAIFSLFAIRKFLFTSIVVPYSTKHRLFLLLIFRVAAWCQLPQVETVLMHVHEILAGWEHLRHEHSVWQERVAYLLQLVVAQRVVAGGRQVPQPCVDGYGGTLRLSWPFSLPAATAGVIVLILVVSYLGCFNWLLLFMFLTRFLAPLLIEGGDAHHSRHGTLCPCPIGEVPPVQQVDALACGRHPQQLNPEAEAVVTMLSQPHAKAHIQRITSSITLRLQLGFRQHEVVDSHAERSAAHGTANINLITFHCSSGFATNISAVASYELPSSDNFSLNTI